MTKTDIAERTIVTTENDVRYIVEPSFGCYTVQRVPDERDVSMLGAWTRTADRAYIGETEAGIRLLYASGGSLGGLRTSIIRRITKA